MNFLAFSLRLWSGFDVFHLEVDRTNPNAIALRCNHFILLFCVGTMLDTPLQTTDHVTCS